ncbi:menaquinone biosynthetic enzyme MqnA/MqnD family protein [Sphingobacterium haloxyli]|uniref:Chorismate dehydratase n=1 Tax=Sphingobacterium haloxyli TaxID=2100533 RepID=A0A2S9J0K2_9SPHI|nr:menaquinone biosynthesis protein [Sphingobacterium haloxyli]PRD46290.1 radical SAM protein [Sphingobacterium haloxyli]
MDKIVVSAVSYTNTLPFLSGIRNSEVINSINLSVDYPSECARKVIDKEVDMGIIPIAALAKLPNYYIIGDYCIGSDGAVDSVFIFSEKPITEIKTLLLDKQSNTSNGLAQILLKYYWKRDIQILTEGEADAHVLIGDRTFGKKNKVPFAYDMGYYWKEMTGLPFAFAVWVSNKELPEDFKEAFNKALAAGVSDPEAVIQGLSTYEDFDYHKYLKESLDFYLTADKRKAIDLYLELYAKL